MFFTFLNTKVVVWSIFLKISHSQENTCARVSLLKKLKIRDSGTGVVSSQFCEIFKSTYFLYIEHLQWLPLSIQLPASYRGSKKYIRWIVKVRCFIIFPRHEILVLILSWVAADELLEFDHFLGLAFKGLGNAERCYFEFFEWK